VHEKAVPEIQGLSMDRKGVAAYKLLQEAENASPGDPILSRGQEAHPSTSQSSVSFISGSSGGT
jgi:hypothetical protein